MAGECIMADIGKPQRIIEVMPLTQPAPIKEPIQEPAPSEQPVKPEKEKVPA